VTETTTITAAAGGDKMATVLGFEGSVVLVAILLLLAVGLAGALFAATREEARRTAGETRRTR
jgi:hypothetical protein